MRYSIKSYRVASNMMAELLFLRDIGCLLFMDYSTLGSEGYHSSAPNSKLYSWSFAFNEQSFVFIKCIFVAHDRVEKKKSKTWERICTNDMLHLLTDWLQSTYKVIHGRGKISKSFLNWNFNVNHSNFVRDKKMYLVRFQS